MSVALVTGATGFIGSHVVRRLLYKGVAVHVLCRPTSKFWRISDLLGSVHTHAIDLNDRAGLHNLVRAVRPEQIFHLASATVVAGAAASAADLIETNLLGTVNLIDACDAIDYQSLVCTGDSFEYAPSADPLPECGKHKPQGLHGISKLAATLYAEAESAGRPIVTLRLFSTYGPGDNPRRLVPRIIAGAMQRTPVSLSRPEVTRDWIYVDDVVDLYLEAAERAAEISGNVFNVGCGRATSIAELVEIVFRLTASAAEIRWGVFPAPKHDDYPWIADMRHTFKTFRWRPRVSLEEGLCRSINSFRG